jgi:Tfp pilus assembly protein PilO
MFRFIIPIFLIGISIGGFFTFVRPAYDEVVVLKSQVSAYNDALNNSKSLEQERDKLVTKLNNISPANRDKIQKMLPDGVDNIRLILEIEKIASIYGMALKDVRYEDEQKAEEEGIQVIEAGTVLGDLNKEYGVWNLEFSVEGPYTNFINFTRDMEKNLRLVDVSSVEFSSLTSSRSASDSYNYTFKIKTYWLKN